MRLPVLAILMASLVLPGCVMARDAVSAVKAIPRPHFVAFDPAPYPVDSEGLIEYCQAVEARFNYGRELVGNGNISLAQGRKTVSEGTFKIRDGEAKVTSGETALSNARRDLGLKLGKDTPTLADVDLLTDPSLWSRIDNNLDNGLRTMERGKDLIEIGERRVAEGRARIDRGISLIRQGQDAMRADLGKCRAAS